MILWEAHEGEDVSLGFIHERGELRHFGTQLIGNLAPLLASRLGILLNEGGADEGGNDTAALAAGVGQDIAHEVHPTALPGGMKDFADGGLNAFMGIGDHQLDATQATPGVDATATAARRFFERRLRMITRAFGSPKIPRTVGPGRKPGNQYVSQSRRIRFVARAIRN